MKRILSFTLILISILTLVSCSREEGEAPLGMKIASDDAAEFYLYVPKEWEVTTEKNSLMASARASESDPSNVTMIGFEDGGNEYETIDEFWAYYASEFETRIFDLDENGATTFKLTLGGESTTIDGIAAKRYEYSGSVAGSEFKYAMVIAKSGPVFYIFTYTSKTEFYDNNLSDIDKVLNYIEFK